MNEITKKYSNNDITIVWKPSVCIHSKLCWKGESGLINVFNPSLKPWINPEGGTTEEIIKRINNCPSGALSYYHNNQENKTTENTVNCNIEVIANGPLKVHGTINVKDTNGNKIIKSNVTTFCRCGASGNKPYCDGSHRKINFEG